MPPLLEQLDINLFYLINHKLASPVGDRLLPLLASPENGGVILLLSSLIIDLKHHRKENKPAGIIPLSLISAYLLGEGFLKPLFNRKRPYEVMPGARLLIPAPPSTSTSFPSTHALTAFTYATALSRIYPGWSAVFYVLAGTVSFSRVYAGVHFPGDVLAGSLLGCFWGRQFAGG